MATDLTTKYLPYVDEQFVNESKVSLLTNNDFDFTGAKTVKIYKVNTAGMNDYDRDGGGMYPNSRFGQISNLTGTTEEFTLRKTVPSCFPLISWITTKHRGTSRGVGISPSES